MPSTPAALDRAARVQRAPNITFEPFDDEYLAIDANSGFCYSLNEVAWQVWQQLEAPAALGEVIDRVCAQYAVDAATCQADVLELALRLHEFGLLRVVEPST